MILNCLPFQVTNIKYTNICQDDEPWAHSNELKNISRTSCLETQQEEFHTKRNFMGKYNRVHIVSLWFSISKRGPMFLLTVYSDRSTLQVMPSVERRNICLTNTQTSALFLLGSAGWSFGRSTRKKDPKSKSSTVGKSNRRSAIRLSRPIRRHFLKPVKLRPLPLPLKASSASTQHTCFLVALDVRDEPASAILQGTCILEVKSV